MEDFAIRVTGLSKIYFISKSNLGLPFIERLKQMLSLRNKHNNSEEFYALNDVNFEIKKGETLGIIGRNGAGKSTLLKMLSEVVEPSKGKIEINGIVASVLEVGMGFHPDLTGRENIYLSGSLYGLNKKQIEKSFNEIVEYSGVERFIDTPVKHYSSGMYTRLAFAVVTNIDADIFLFDEVLSVGDLSFQLKCYEKIRQLAASNKTVIMVSHNNNDIIELCSKAMCFEKGKLVDYGDTGIVKKYFERSITYDPKINIKSLLKDGEESEPEFKNILIKEWIDADMAPGDEGIKIKKIYLVNESRVGDDCIYTNDRLTLNIEYEKFNEDDFYNMGFAASYMNNIFMGFDTITSDLNYQSYLERGIYTAKVLIDELFFNDAVITLGCFVSRNNGQFVYFNKNVLQVKINQYIPEGEMEYCKPIQRFSGPLRPKMKWEIIKK